MAATESGEESARKAPRPARRHRWGWRIAGLVLVSPLLFAIAAAALMLGQDITAPSWVTNRVEAEAERALGGGTLRFGEMTVTLGRDLHPVVGLSDAVLRDSAGQAILRVPSARALVSPRGLLQGDLLVQEVEVSGVELDLRRSSSGAFELAFGSDAAVVEEASSFTGLLERIDADLRRPEWAALERLRADGVVINYADARSERTWIVDGGRIDIGLTDSRLSLRTDLALLTGRAYVTTAAFTYDVARDSGAAVLGLSVDDAVASDLASQLAGLSFLGAVDAPMSANLRGRIDEGGVLGPVNASLDISAGALTPGEGGRPVPFQSAEIYLDYDPGRGEIAVSRMSIESAWGSVEGSGTALLRELVEGWPGAIVGQFTLSNIVANPGELYAEPLTLPRADLDLRLGLDPFELRVGQAIVDAGDARVRLSGRVGATPEGWAIAVDGGIDRIDSRRAMTFWPESFRPQTRAWFDRNILGGLVTDLGAGLRLRPGERARHAVDFEFVDARVRFLGTLPPIEAANGYARWENGDFTLVTDAGHVVAPQGGRLDLAGSVFRIPEAGVPDAPAEITLAIEGTVTAALAVLDLPPFRFLQRANLPVTLADGQVSVTGTLGLPLKPRIDQDEVDFDVAARLRDIRSDVVVPERLLSAASLALATTPAGLEISGPMRLDALPLTATFERPFGEGTGGLSSVTARVELSERFLDTFSIPLPPGTVRGEGVGEARIDLSPGEAPRFALTSDLAGLRLSIPPLGWGLPAEATGRLALQGSLGAVPSVDRIVLDAPGLLAEGRIGLREGGGLDTAEFDRVSSGGWLDGPVTLTGQGAGRPPAITVGGSIDLRRAEFGTGGGDGGPVALRLDRLQVTNGIALTDFAGDFTTTGGLSGPFRALVNGSGPVQGTVVPQNGRAAVRIVSDDAGAVIEAADLLDNAVGGRMEMILVPAAAEGSYDGQLAINDIRVRNVPGLASILDAISVVGLLQQLDGQGLAFSDVAARFRLSPDRIVVTESSAVGASLGLSLDGVYLPATRQMDFQGVISPVYFINAIGAGLTRRGEGLLGFNFTLRGTPDDLSVGVNPLSVFTPGMFREIFRRPPPEIPE